MSERDSDHTITLDGLIWPIIALVMAFWILDGGVRVDCALGVTPACQSIASQYAPTPTEMMGPGFAANLPIGGAILAGLGLVLSVGIAIGVFVGIVLF